MNRISRNLTTIYRTERLIARRRLAVVQQQTILMILAGIAALAGLVSLNIAFYFALNTWMSATYAAAVLAFGNLLLAVLFALFSKGISAEQEIAPAVELRDMAIAEIEDDLENMATDARELVQAVKNIGANPLGSIPALLLPIISALLKEKRGN
ncbi:MAG: hypothetical protein AB3N19_08330 [Ruegeria sp.]